MSLPGQLLLHLSKQHLNLFSKTIWRINVNELRPLLNLTLMYFHKHNTHGNLKPRKIKTRRNWTNTSKSELVLIPYIFKRRSFKCVFSELNIHRSSIIRVSFRGHIMRSNLIPNANTRPEEFLLIRVINAPNTSRHENALIVSSADTHKLAWLLGYDSPLSSDV